MAQDPLTADAFALSPIAARASLPSEADYDAIRDAFMETTRGRWFLDQYGKRNRNADTTMVLDAVARIEAGIAERIPATPSPAEIVAMVRPLIAEARAAADAAMDAPQTDDHIAAGRRGARIIREIAWSLRETGTDPRICNILDQQLLALEQLHDHIAGDSRRALIGEVFDDLVLRIEDISNGVAAAAQRVAPQIKPEPVETVGANADIAVVQTDTDPGAGAPTSSEIADDDAVLDLIATEMAAPDVDVASERDDEFDQVDSRIAELRRVVEQADLSPATAILAPPKPDIPPLAPSLGAAILAGGLVRPQRSGSNALAPFRRMTQVEKIALFS